MVSFRCLHNCLLNYYFILLLSFFMNVLSVIQCFCYSCGFIPIIFISNLIIALYAYSYF